MAGFSITRKSGNTLSLPVSHTVDGEPYSLVGKTVIYRLYDTDNETILLEFAEGSGLDIVSAAGGEILLTASAEQMDLETGTYYGATIITDPGDATFELELPDDEQGDTWTIIPRLSELGGAGTPANPVDGSLYPLANYAALDAYDVTHLTTGAVRYVAGYSTAGDGGGGHWLYSSTSTATADVGTIRAAAGGTGRWLRQFSGPLDVRWFGAKGDGATDCTVALQDALDAANEGDIKTVFVPGGTYCVSGPLYQWYNTVLIGENSSYSYANGTTSKIKYTTAAATDALLVLDEDHANASTAVLVQTTGADGSYIRNYAMNAVVKDITLDTSTATLATPLWLYRVACVDVENVSLYSGYGELARVDSCNLINFRRPRCIYNQGRGIIFWATADSAIDSADYGGTYGAGLSLINSNKNRIRDNFIYNAHPARSYTPTVDTGTDTFTSSNHRLVTGTPVRCLANAGTLPSPLAENVTYYAIRTGTNTFKLASQYDQGVAGGALQGVALNITTSGSAGFSFHEVSPYACNLHMFGCSGNVVTGGRYDQPLEQAFVAEYCSGITVTGASLSEAGTSWSVYTGSASTPNVLFRGCTDVTLTGNIIGKLRAASEALVGVKLEAFNSTNCERIAVNPNVYYGLTTNLELSNSSQKIAGALGTLTNDTATTGMIGQEITASVGSAAPVSLTSAIVANVTTLALTPGEWEISGWMVYALASATTTSKFLWGVSATSATIGSSGQYLSIYQPLTTTTASIEFTMPKVVVRVSSNTTYYVIARATFSAGTIGAYGDFIAKRIR